MKSSKKDIKMIPFSVVTSVYKNDNPEFVRIALDSMLVNQSIKPTEIILVRDGLVSDNLESLLYEYEQKYVDIVHIIRLERNKGLGNALMLGVEAAKFNYIARMDSDDICKPNRFELQLNFFDTHDDIDIVGGQISEFVDSPDNIIGYRKVPLENMQIIDFMRNRCALNHDTVMFKRSSVLKAGNYQDWSLNEDYYLWIRMIMIGCKFANIPEILVDFRSGANHYLRRGGRKYYESEKGIKKLQLKYKMITLAEYVISVLERYIIQIIMPNWMRGLTIRTLTRSRHYSTESQNYYKKYYAIYRHAWRYNGAPNDEPQLTDTQCSELLKCGGWMVRNTFDFDQKEESDFWYVIKDSFGGMDEHTSNERRKIRRALSVFEYKLIDIQVVINHCYPILKATFDDYRVKDRQMSKKIFDRYLQYCGENQHDFWGIFDKNNKQLVGFSTVHVWNNSCEYGVNGIYPQYKHNASYPFYGLFYKMNEYYLGEKKFKYVADGTRSITEHSEIQPFLIHNFKFRKAYCKLKIKYKWWFGAIVKILLPIEKLISNKSVKAVLKMDRMRWK